MRSNGAARQSIEQATGLSARNEDNVIDMVRHAVGSVLDGMAEARDKVQAAKRLHDIAKSVGDHEVEAMMARELRRLSTEARMVP